MKTGGATMNRMKPLLRMSPVVLPRLVGLMSPVLRDSLVGDLDALNRQARETENPVDDVVVGLLFELLGFNSLG